MARLPEYDLSPAADALREEVRTWLREYWLGPRQAAHAALPRVDRCFDDEFAQELAKKGWLWLSRPKEYGGTERTPLEELAFVEEMAYAGAPTHTYVIGCYIVAPALMAFGTQEQKEKYFPLIVSGEIGAGVLGYSEPDSGSDLASLRTKAVRDGDDWIINGQKIWNTGAEKAKYAWLIARTDPDAQPPHAGLSMFIIPMDTPGISVTPMMAMYGHYFCQVFYDNVRIPASSLVGKVNDGWKVITHALASERIIMGGLVAEVRALFDELTDYIKTAAHAGKPLGSDPIVRDRIGALAAELEVARQFALRSTRIVEQGKVPIYEAGMSKAYTAELHQRIIETSLEILGMQATLSEASAAAPLRGKLEYALYKTIMEVVGGGTNEIQRSLIARLGLGLPR